MNGLRDRGGCFGFGVSADRPLRYLRDGGGPSLTVLGGADDRPASSTPLMRWAPPHVAFRADLHLEYPGYRLHVEGTGWFDIDTDGCVIRLPDAPDTSRLEERMWGVPALLCFLHRGDHALHAACVQVGEGAVAIAAPGRHGKTTLAAAFVSAGHRLLSEDLACIRPGADPTVLPGPAMLRLRHDVAERVLPSGGRVLDVTTDRVHIALDDRGTADAVPLRAVVLLRNGDDPHPRLEPVAPVDAVPDLWSLSFSMPTDAHRARCFDGVTALAVGVPVWNLHRRMTFEDLPAVVETVAEGLSAHV
jgi:hypothetical protein